MIVLSILIPTIVTEGGIPGREILLQRLLSILEPQKTPEVQIITNPDGGKKTIGQKRNELVAQSTGKYICFVDDDDLVSPQYVAKVLAALKSDPDCVGFKVERTSDGTATGTAVHSLKYERYGDGKAAGGSIIWERTPNHLNPIRRTIAIQCEFPHQSFGEDSAYAVKVRPLLKTEKFIDEVLYRYEYVSNKQKVDKWSQNDEQGHITGYFYATCGRFLDIGAHDGETLSNTRALAMANWAGVLVEPAWSVIECLKHNCRQFGEHRMIAVHAALTVEDGPDIDFWDACGDLLSSAKEKQLDRWGKVVPFTKLKVSRISVASLFSKYGYNFDFISLDTELMNWELFQALPWAELRKAGVLRMICVEHDGHADEMKAIAAKWGLTIEHCRNADNIILARPQ